ncbi:MAG: class I SAM-dependent methyltransferase [Saprospiraceae bacterium]|nr:class I SAM-dependent methyltransferase [Saprospiraceae bacterium]MBK8451066.1 class I SAM-dependent methyltransferase [Saprospiraceae bacterium]MBK8485785.1 class I SAM-dependent methyltransferase [Saprospiraceae bacterium]MBK9222376.1 class I SAM-dependent methyltransferase [Saprospiraceae bacterium]MBK9723050.1 class I SAM-dependent methyltransferase [Saprospiraceae bacterium]
MDHKITHQDIINYYDDCEGDYRLLWHLNEQSAMHYGYWKEDTKLLRDALKNMNDYVFSVLNLNSGERYLDAGCGIGGSSMYAASKIDCEVYGISLSEKQISTATQKSAQKMKMGITQFTVQNYCNTNFQDGFFDGIFGIESICHANPKSDFLLEASRLLKTGGRLVVADFFKSKNQHPPEAETLLLNWANSWAVPSFEYSGSFIDQAAQFGLKLVENNTITSAIQRSAKRLYWCFYPGLICHGFLSLFGLRNQIQGTNVWSTYYQYKSLKQGLWDYRVLKFIKI